MFLNKSNTASFFIQEIPKNVTSCGNSSLLTKIYKLLSRSVRYGSLLCFLTLNWGEESTPHQCHSSCKRPVLEWDMVPAYLLVVGKFDVKFMLQRISKLSSDCLVASCQSIRSYVRQSLSTNMDLNIAST